jgi:hypothetical protein
MIWTKDQNMKRAFVKMVLENLSSKLDVRRKTICSHFSARSLEEPDSSQVVVNGYEICIFSMTKKQYAKPLFRTICLFYMEGITHFAFAPSEQAMKHSVFKFWSVYGSMFEMDQIFGSVLHHDSNLHRTAIAVTFGQEQLSAFRTSTILASCDPM